MMASSQSDSSAHVVLFPFMSISHATPVLHLARLLLHRRHVAVTIITTPANRPFISQSLSDTAAAIIDLPFPENIPGLPAGVENLDKLPSKSLLHQFAAATKLMQTSFETAIGSLPRVSCIISDGFLSWTVDSAAKFSIPRFAFYNMSSYATTVSRTVSTDRIFEGPESDDEPVLIPAFPWLKLTRSDLAEPFNKRESNRPKSGLAVTAVAATQRSHGLIVNSFYELEPAFVDYWNKEFTPKAWCVGPFCLAEPDSRFSGEAKTKPVWLSWLDGKKAEGKPVLYVAFGTQAEISPEQLKEIAVGLEESEVNFLWVVRTEGEIEGGFGERGMIVREWVDQRTVLKHETVKGFLSHCGWNSTVEGICAGVPILAWPMMAEQHLNARMVVEEIKIGLRVETIDGSVRGFVKSDGLKKMVKELMEGETAMGLRKKAEELSTAARMAVEKDGSSWKTLNQLIDDVMVFRGDV